MSFAKLASSVDGGSVGSPPPTAVPVLTTTPPAEELDGAINGLMSELIKAPGFRRNAALVSDSRDHVKGHRVQPSPVLI